MEGPRERAIHEGHQEHADGMNISITKTLSGGFPLQATIDYREYVTELGLLIAMGMIRPQSKRVQMMVSNHQKWGGPAVTITTNKIGGAAKGAWPTRNCGYG